MSRLGLLSPSELTPAQREAYGIMHQYTTKSYGNKFTYLDSQSRLVGPFGIQLHHPEVAKAFIAFTKSLGTIPGFPHDVKETAIVAVGSRLGAAYEAYAHEALSGFTEDEKRQLHAGQCPEHFSQEQRIAFKVAIDLGKPGPLPTETWNEAVKLLGVNGATALVHYVGFYSYISTILNGFDGKIPR